MMTQQNPVRASRLPLGWEVPDDFIAAVFGRERKAPESSASAENRAAVEFPVDLESAGGSHESSL